MRPCEVVWGGVTDHQLCLRISSILNLLVGSTVRIWEMISFASSERLLGNLYSPESIF